MMAMADWVPARWASSDPQTLRLLKGTGVNCLLVDSRNLTPEFVKRANAQGVAAVAVVGPGGQAPHGNLGVQAILLEGDFDAVVRASLNQAGVPVIELPSRQKIRLDSTDSIAGTTQGLWPGIVIEHGGTVMAGPSSNPWINTNAGFLRFLRAAMDSVLWLGATPPAGMVIPPERYGIAMADAAAAGARWIISLDHDLETRLLAGDAEALRDWKRITAYGRYFEEHREWRGYRPFSRLALIQDSASGGLLSASLLDLMFAQHIAARAIPAARVTPASLSGLQTVIQLASIAPGALDNFERAGGRLLKPPPDWRFGADAPGATVPNKQQLRRIQDIWEMLYNATARKNFGARSFNTAGILFHVLSSPGSSAGDQRLLVHLVNYTGYPADTITVHALGTWKRATLYRPEGAPVNLPVYPVSEGTGIDLDKLDVVATLLLEGTP